MSAEGVEHDLGPGVDDRHEYVASREDPADRRIASGKALSRDEDIRGDAPVFSSEARACSPEARHDLVENQQDAMLVAQLAYGGPVVVRRHDRAAGGADDRFGDERRDGVGARGLDRRCEGIYIMATGVRVMGAERTAQGIRGRRLRIVLKYAFKAHSPRSMSPHGSRGDRRAVVRQAPADDLVAAGLALSRKMLNRNLDGSFVRFRSAGGKVRTVEGCGEPLVPQARHEAFSTRSAPGWQHVAPFAGFAGNRLGDLVAAVPYVHDDRACGRVDDLAATIVEQHGALGSIDAGYVAAWKERPEIVHGAMIPRLSGIWLKGHRLAAGARA